MKLVLFALFPVLSAMAQESFDSLMSKAEQEQKAGRFKESLALTERAQPLIVTEPESARYLNTLGFLQYQLGDVAKGAGTLGQALSLWRRIHPGSVDVAVTAQHLAQAYRDSGKFEDAIRLAEEASAIRAATDGGNSPVYAEVRAVLGAVLIAKGDYAGGERVLSETKSIFETVGPSMEYVVSLSDLGYVKNRLGKLQEWLQLQRLAIKTCKELGEENHITCAIAVGNLGHLEMELGDYAAAKRSMTSAMVSVQMLFPKGHSAIASLDNNLGVLALRSGDYGEGERHLRTAVNAERLRLKSNPGNRVPLITKVHNLAALLVKLGRMQEAGTLFAEAVSLIEQSQDRPAFQYATVLSGLGGWLRRQSRFEEASQRLEKSLAICEGSLGKEHRTYADALTELALVQWKQGNRAKAEENLLAATGIITRSNGAENPALVANMIHLAELYVDMDRNGDAIRWFERAYEVQRQATAQVMAIGSETAKSVMARSHASALSSLLARLSKFPNGPAHTLAYETVAWHKARALDHVRDWRGLVRSSADAAAARKFGEWESLMGCRAALSVAMGFRDLGAPGPADCSLPGTALAGRFTGLADEARRGAAGNRKASEALVAIRQHAETIEEELGRSVPTFKDGFAAVRLKEIQNALGAGEVLVEFAAWGGEEGKRYGAFIVRREGDPDWLDLGPATRIEGPVRDLLLAANDWSATYSRREFPLSSTAEATATDALARLSSGPLAPLLKRLAGYSPSQVRLVADGMLSLLPFEALSLGKQYLIEKFPVSYLLTARDLLARPASSRDATAPLIVSSPGPGLETSARRDPPTSPFRAQSLERLTLAGKEEKLVRGALVDAKFLGLGQATESVVKGVDSPEILHVIGHAVVSGKDCNVAETDCGQAVMNLSAIVLEEAYGRGRQSGEDGMLTALELQNIRLRSTQMLVLSQCRMADGVPSSGDGVYGMRRAVRMAGARSLAAPLWNVLDASQPEFMQDFYGELRKGSSRPAALRNTKLRLLARPRTKHPLFWAPFILIGDAGPLRKEIFR